MIITFLSFIGNALLNLFRQAWQIYGWYLVIFILISYVLPFLLYPASLLVVNLVAGLAVGTGSFLTHDTIIYAVGLFFGDIILITLISVFKYFK